MIYLVFSYLSVFNLVVFTSVTKMSYLPMCKLKKKSEINLLKSFNYYANTATGINLTKSYIVPSKNKFFSVHRQKQETKKRNFVRIDFSS